MAFELPKLPYPLDALQPHISKETLEYHYGKHHQAYVTNLNKLIAGGEFANATLEQIILKSSGGIFNNAAQIWNHTFYWDSLSPTGGGLPSGKIADAINSSFGSFDKFKEEFSLKSTTLFGAGWVFLAQNASGKLEIRQESNAGTPLTSHLNPILTCDVWEHAYYIDFRNVRASYVEVFWKLVNWDFANKRLK
jgi:Fe-Mn family superoxide dismutase